MGIEELAEAVNKRKPELVADLRLYTTEEGGRQGPVPPGWGCPTMTSPEGPGWDAWPQLGDEWLQLGETRRVGFVFLSPEGAETMRTAGKFYLWEGGIKGEAIVVPT